MTRNSRRFTRRATSFFVLLALILGTVVPSFAATQRRRTRHRRTVVHRTVNTEPAVRYFTVPANQVIRVRMDTELNSRTARVGDRFSASVTEPVYGESGIEVIPVGSKVWGRVTVVNRAQRRTPGNISVSFYQVETPNRARYTING
ncbi:MAG: hypothetical protein DMF67_04145, partial [Acidobacteria bacterium]